MIVPMKDLHVECFLSSSPPNPRYTRQVETHPIQCKPPDTRNTKTSRSGYVDDTLTNPPKIWTLQSWPNYSANSSTIDLRAVKASETSPSFAMAFELLLSSATAKAAFMLLNIAPVIAA